LPTPRPFLHISGMFPAERGCLAVMWPIGVHPTNKNEILAWDLAFDPSELFSMDADTVRTRLFSKTDALPEGVTRLPLKSVHLNKSPMVINKLQTLSADMATRWGIDIPLALRHAEIAARAPDLGGLWRQVFQRPEEAANDVDEDLYGGFVGNNDRRKLNELRALSPQKLAAAHVSFDDQRLEELAFRYRARNFPETLTAEDRQRWEEHRAARLFDGEGKARTVDMLFEEIDNLSESTDERGEEILGALYDYAEMIAPARD
jgi:exodeoxyribonuclease-1